MDIKLWFKAVDIVEHSCDVDFLVGAQHKKGVRAQRKVKRIRVQRKVKSLLLDMAEHPAGEEVAAQLVEHFEPVRGNLTFKWIPGDGECQFRAIACQVADYGYEGFRRLREDVARHVELRSDDYLEYRCNGKDV